MIKVSGKEFRLKFAKYSRGLDEVIITGRGGEVVGAYRSAAIMEKEEKERLTLENGEGIDYETGEIVDMEAVSDEVNLGKNKVNLGKNKVNLGKNKVNLGDTFIKNAAYERISGMFGNEEGDFENVVEGEKCFKCGGLAAGKFEEYDFEMGEDHVEWICMKCAKRGGVKIKT